MKFKKIMSVIASAIMLSSTIGFAAAATFPAPFSSGSAIVYGSTGDVQTDMAAAVNIQTAIGQISGGAGANVPEGSWQVKTSSDNLELGEAIGQVGQTTNAYAASEDLPILADGELSNEKGTAKYSQYLYFEDNTASVTYQEDDDENVGLFYKVDSGNVIARYVLQFTTDLKSDITTANVLEDIEDKEVTLLGKTYAIITATNTSAGVTDLVLMSGSNKVTISNGEELTVDGKTISVLVTATNSAQFTVDGEQTSKLDEGGTAKLADGTWLGVSSITYQNFAGGLMQATAYIGADKVELKDGSSLIVNSETISDAAVNITETIASNDISISAIAINMTAEDDLYVPVGGKLSEAANLDEPQVLFTQNWDIVFDGLTEEQYESVDLDTSGDAAINLKFENYDGDDIDLPLIYANASGVYGGDKSGHELVLNSTDNSTGVKKNQYFILNTADPTSSTNNARSYVVQYKGSDDVDGTDPKATFNVLGVGDKEATLSTAGVAILRNVGGADFTFNNVTSCDSNDCALYLTSTDYTIGVVNGSKSNFLRTKYNALITITDTNTTVADANGHGSAYSDWKVNISLDDANRDGDRYTLTAAKQLFIMTYNNDSSNEITAAVTGGNSTLWVTDPADSTHSTYIDNYGLEFDRVNPSSSPDTLKLKIPESIVEPKVFVTSGAVTSTTTGGLALIVDDTKIDTVKDKNLIVVGGSCINTVAAKLLGSDVPLCTSAFTAKTGVSAGQYIIKTYPNPYTAADSGKVAMLVAGYNAADTVSAGAKVAEKTITTDVNTGNVYPILTA